MFYAEDILSYLSHLFDMSKLLFIHMYICTILRKCLIIRSAAKLTLMSQTQKLNVSMSLCTIIDCVAYINASLYTTFGVTTCLSRIP